MFDTILNRRGAKRRGQPGVQDAAQTRPAEGTAPGDTIPSVNPAPVDGRPGPVEVHDPERARRLFGDLVPLPPGAAEPPPADLSALLSILSFPPPDPDHPLFERLAGPGTGTTLPRDRTADDAARPPLAPVQGVAPPSFASLLRHDRAARAGRRAAWTGLGAGVQACLVGAAVVLASAVAAPEREEIEMIVPVHLPAAAPRKTAGPPGLPGMPAAPAPPRRAPAPGARPRATLPPPPPTALLQPREVKAAMRVPDPDEPIEALPEGADEGEYAPGEVEGGVIGGVVGGGGGGAWGGGAAVAGTSAGAQPQEIEDAPQYMTAGFRKPVEADPGCVGRAIRLPRELTGFTSGPITVRVAIGGDGRVGRVELLSSVPDLRIAHAIEAAVRACPWRGGADAGGRPVAIWVVMPIRFEGV
ncbi:outer membrane transport energization protein TonB [Anaeromyxobacter dehalogenans 2CP-C]|uniref:Outer membrane transport energization protein TonB n=1 Tax=Anaeromyxobacter dehalogenans (strain 2CP-C) TaxID=290397 RepID=Q2IJR6_ANADE|nr:outer membrane transport energization protein TonB [Anaeromyxobacter dehalogenans 2CP-C]